MTQTALNVFKFMIKLTGHSGSPVYVNRAHIITLSEERIPNIGRVTILRLTNSNDIWVNEDAETILKLCHDLN